MHLKEKKKKVFLLNTEQMQLFRDQKVPVNGKNNHLYLPCAVRDIKICN